MTPKISIVMPVYNVEKYLRECLDSVRVQTFTDWECICVDDGSTDASPAILDEYATKDSRFRVVRREHSNAGACRNAGLDLSAGEYLLFLDSDDIFHPKLLACLLSAIKSGKSEIASCGMFEFNDKTNKFSWPGDKAKTKATKHPADTVDLFARWVGWAWDKLFRRSFILENNLRFQEIQSSNDACFTYSALTIADAVTEVGSVLIAHRKRNGSIEKTRNGHADNIAKAILAYRDAMAERNAFSKHSRLEVDFKKWALHILLWHLDTIDSLVGYEKLYSVIPKLATYIGLDRLDKSSFDSFDDSWDRLSLILKGGTITESIRFHENLLFKRICQANQYKRVANSRDYKLGNAILLIPRWLKRLVNG